MESALDPAMSVLFQDFGARAIIQSTGFEHREIKGPCYLPRSAHHPLDEINGVQQRFLRSIGITELEALTEYRLAPLAARRDMAMLWLLHKLNTD